MSTTSRIEWTDTTWNPLAGCSKVSQGCKNCYAMRHAQRLAANPNPKVSNAYSGLVNGHGDWTGLVRLLPERLSQPLHWRKPRRIFVNSLSDLFHPSVPFEFIARVFGIMAAAPWHTFQVLTKRPERAEAFFQWIIDRWSLTDHVDANVALSLLLCDDLGRDWRVSCDQEAQPWPLPNVWLGTSVENQDAADERIPYLLKCPAAVRFLSCEPLLGPVTLPPDLVIDCPTCDGWGKTEPRGSIDCETCHGGGEVWRVHWLICGGESGPRARPMHPEWVHRLNNRCGVDGIPFFFKQWGAFRPSLPMEPATHGVFASGEVFRAGELMYPDGEVARRLSQKLLCEEWQRMTQTSKREAGRLLWGREWNEMPEVQHDS